jgi:integrase
MKIQRTRYQQGSIRKVARATGFAWEARFSEVVNDKRKFKSLYFSGSEYPTEGSVRKALELAIVQRNSDHDREKVDAKFGAVTALYRDWHLPNLRHSTQQTNRYLLASYIEPRFAGSPLRSVTPLVVTEWLRHLQLRPTSKASIRSVLRVCFDLASLHQFLPANERNPMSLVKIKGTSKRQKAITKISIKQFQDLVQSLPEPINLMVLLTGCYGLRVSETLALQWRDLDPENKEIMIQRAFTHGALDEPKTPASTARLPMHDSLFRILEQWRPKTDGSEWVFPSRRTGGVRSASALLTKGLQPVARQIGLGHMTWHTLRHACRSWLDSGKTQLGVQKDLLRHADIGTTMNVYGGALSTDMKRAHNRLVNRLVPGTLLAKK